jgi:hypothetical protein
LQRCSPRLPPQRLQRGWLARRREPKPGFYAVSTEDRTINPDLKRFMAKRMGATTIDIKASHL